MRKPRDIDAELKSLADRQRSLKTKRITQLGELVVATGADALDAETLAGALLAATGDTAAQEAWRANGARFFRSERRRTRETAGAAQNGGGDAPHGNGA